MADETKNREQVLRTLLGSIQAGSIELIGLQGYQEASALLLFAAEIENWLAPLTLDGEDIDPEARRELQELRRQEGPLRVQRVLRRIQR